MKMLRILAADDFALCLGIALALLVISQGAWAVARAVL